MIVHTHIDVQADSLHLGSIPAIYMQVSVQFEVDLGDMAKKVMKAMKASAGKFKVIKADVTKRQQLVGSQVITS